MSSQSSNSAVPHGVVIHHLASQAGIYVGSPSLAILPDGTYVASHDQFGPGSTEHQSGVTLVFASQDRGGTWNPVARMEGMFWGNLFVHDGMLYLLGTTRHHGLLAIRRSVDKGKTWTVPVDGDTGLLTERGKYHTGPMPVVLHNEYLWRAVEDASKGKNWGERYSPMMISAPICSDLLRRENWRFSNCLSHSRSWLDGKFGAWLEGNAVTSPEGKMINLLRVDYAPGGKAAWVEVSPDGDRLDFDPQSGFIDFPGGPTKFAIRHDPLSQRYWSLVNDAPDLLEGENAALVRNTLSLSCSVDLKKWEVRKRLLYHPDKKSHGFQYADWQFDGDDIVAAIRTAFDDAAGGAHSAHDANYLTFHRFEAFRRTNP